MIGLFLRFALACLVVEIFATAAFVLDGMDPTTAFICDHRIEDPELRHVFPQQMAACKLGSRINRAAEGP